MLKLAALVAEAENNLGYKRECIALVNLTLCSLKPSSRCLGLRNAEVKSACFVRDLKLVIVVGTV